MEQSIVEVRIDKQTIGLVTSNAMSWIVRFKGGTFDGAKVKVGRNVSETAKAAGLEAKRRLLTDANSAQGAHVGFGRRVRFNSRGATTS